ncbi:hypothetical protein H6F98_24140 [Microcoleus sp. FACHB-SPT15]|nr:hypothetical protein [Microcoleus sp. FACHB-SPT15]
MDNLLGKASSTALTEGTELSDESPITVSNPLEPQPLAPLLTTLPLRQKATGNA